MTNYDLNWHVPSQQGFNMTQYRPNQNITSQQFNDFLGGISPSTLETMNLAGTGGSIDFSNWPADSVGTQLKALGKKATAGGKDADGNPIASPLMQGFDVLNGLGQSWLGMQQLKLGKKALGLQLDAYNTEKKMINNDLRDRDAARLASSPGYKSTTQFA